MYRIYLAARFSRIEEMRQYRSELAEIGVEVNSRWLDEEYTKTQLKSRRVSVPLEEARMLASHDYEDIIDANGILCFTEGPRLGPTRGGRHVEFGIALATKRLYDPRYNLLVIGEPENIFYTLHEVKTFPDWERAREWLKEVAR